MISAVTEEERSIPKFFCKFVNDLSKLFFVKIEMVDN